MRPIALLPAGAGTPPAAAAEVAAASAAAAAELLAAAAAAEVAAAAAAAVVAVAAAAAAAAAVAAAAAARARVPPLRRRWGLAFVTAPSRRRRVKIREQRPRRGGMRIYLSVTLHIRGVVRQLQTVGIPTVIGNGRQPDLRLGAIIHSLRDW